MTYEVFGDNDGPTGFEEAIEAGWIDPADLTKALRDVMDERDRQRSVNSDGEGYSDEHDDFHDRGELARAAAAYALDGGAARVGHLDVARTLWPFGHEAFKGGDDRRSLVKAAALLLAEIERLDRAAEREARR